MRAKALFLLGIVIVVFAVLVLLDHDDNGGTASAATITVGPAGSDADFNDLYSAINASSSGDTIRVWDGEYWSNTSIDVSKRLTIEGNGTAATHFNLSDNGQVAVTSDWVNISKLNLTQHYLYSLNLSNADNSVLDNLHITVQSGPAAHAGYGILIDNCTGVTVNDTTLVSTTSLPVIWSDEYYGLRILVSHHINVTNCDISAFGRSIYLSPSVPSSPCSYITISANTLHNNTYGVTPFTTAGPWHHGNNLTITGNTIRDNQRDGLYLVGWHWSLIANNNFYNIAQEYGTEIFLHIGHHVTVENNTADKGGGTWLQSAEDCIFKNNTLTNGTNSDRWMVAIALVETNRTTVQGNTVRFYGHTGIMLTNADNNTVLNNNVTDCAMWGINLNGTSTDNFIHHNNFLDNSVWGVDDSLGNRWNDTYTNGGGNYWNIQTAPDSFSGANQDTPGADGIVDNNYSVQGSAGAFDEYPQASALNGWAGVEQRILNVNTSTMYSHPNIAVSEASAGNVLRFVGGNYTTLAFSVNKSVVIDGNLSTLWSGGTGPIVNTTTDGVEVWNLTISNAKIAINTTGDTNFYGLNIWTRSPWPGGTTRDGILIWNSTVTISNSDFNVSAYRSDAIRATDSSLAVDNSTIRYWDTGSTGITSTSSPLLVDNCTIPGVAPDFSETGQYGIYATNATIYVRGCDIDNGTALYMSNITAFVNNTDLSDGSTDFAATASTTVYAYNVSVGYNYLPTPPPFGGYLNFDATSQLFYIDLTTITVPHDTINYTLNSTFDNQTATGNATLYLQLYRIDNAAKTNLSYATHFNLTGTGWTNGTVYLYNQTNDTLANVTVAGNYGSAFLTAGISSFLFLANVSAGSNITQYVNTTVWKTGAAELDGYAGTYNWTWGDGNYNNTQSAINDYANGTYSAWFYFVLSSNAKVGDPCTININTGDWTINTNKTYANIAIIVLGDWTVEATATLRLENTSVTVENNDTSIMGNAVFNNTDIILANGTVWLNNTEFSDTFKYRAFYPTLTISNATATMNNVTVRSCVEFLEANRTTLRANNLTLSGPVIAGLNLKSTTAAIRDSSFSGMEGFSAMHMDNSSMDLRSSTVTDGRLGFRNTTAYCLASDLTNSTVYTTSSALNITNTTVYWTRFYSEGTTAIPSTIDAHNVPIDKDKITIYRNSTFRQLWLLHLRARPSYTVWLGLRPYTTNAQGNLLLYGTQWTLNASTFNDTTISNVSVPSTNHVYVHLTKETFVNVSQVPAYMNFSLTRGLNAVPLSYDTYLYASDIVAMVGEGAKIYSRTSSGTYKYMVHRNGKILGDNFELEYHTSYLVYCPLAGFYLQIPTELGARNAMPYSEGLNYVAIPGEATITVSEFFAQNPKIAKIFVRQGTTFTDYYRKGVHESGELPHDAGIYIQATERGEWYWQDLMT